MLAGKDMPTLTSRLLFVSAGERPPAVAAKNTTTRTAPEVGGGAGEARPKILVHLP
jgi:hypothetical protein